MTTKNFQDRVMCGRSCSHHYRLLLCLLVTLFTFCDGTASASNDTDDGTHEKVFDAGWQKWVIATGVVVFISILGLFMVMLLPRMCTVCYNHVQQFFVAMGAGTLAGDALFHQLPHALLGQHDHTEGAVEEEEHGHADNEREIVLKMLVSLMGIFFLFTIEQLLTIVPKYYEKRTKDRRPEAGKKLLSPHSQLGRSVTHDSVTRPSCDEIVFQLHSRNSFLHDTDRGECRPCPADFANSAASGVEDQTDMTPVVCQQPTQYRHGTVLHRCYSAGHLTAAVPADPLKHGAATVGCDVGCQTPGTLMNETSVKSILLTDNLEANDGDNGDFEPFEHELRHHHHGHSHSKLNSVAILVIFADAFHNFVDGIVIGAAFAQGAILAGIGTSIAVMLHEIPHEMGDFALLIKQGLSVKRALFFNLISAVICLVGVLFGVGLGTNRTTNEYIFALGGGLFLYVALVDMLPQVSAVETKQTESMFCHFAFQSLGLFLGIMLMFCISWFETELMMLGQ